MATIKINNLNASGSDLFNDSESFLNELTEDELNVTKGGSTPFCITIVVSVVVYGKYRGWW
ncbi:hypothetical protein [Nostoc sp. PA-18-2419]|uniref:hypothetical protein n=1 Tax=Nostoc sp. PA-18-2419 TaxID=2575443 RepID=UPI00110961B1|nr:hypothetical protein [Nostoc sp. PA-18-2419]